MNEKKLYIISGCNGAGKTTASFTILPEILNCKEFVNADEIAKGLSPFQPETASIVAGRLMLNRINDLLELNKVFAIETTLSTKSYKNTVTKAKEKGYEVILLFFWLPNVDLAIERVKQRVIEGGHNIDHEIIKRRYKNGIRNLFHIYMPIVTYTMIFDNSDNLYELVAVSYKGDLSVINQLKFNNLISLSNEKEI